MYRCTQICRPSPWGLTTKQTLNTHAHRGLGVNLKPVICKQTKGNQKPWGWGGRLWSTKRIHNVSVGNIYRIFRCSCETFPFSSASVNKNKWKGRNWTSLYPTSFSDKLAAVFLSTNRYYRNWAAWDTDEEHDSIHGFIFWICNMQGGQQYKNWE